MASSLSLERCAVPVIQFSISSQIRTYDSYVFGNVTYECQGIFDTSALCAFQHRDQAKCDEQYGRFHLIVVKTVVNYLGNAVRGLNPAEKGCKTTKNQPLQDGLWRSVPDWMAMTA